MSTQVNTEKLPMIEKIGYFFGDFGSQFCWSFIGSYLSVFYTDVVGIAPLAVTVIFLIARIWDAVNDPMMGAIAERTQSRWGRFRPYIGFGAPFLAAASVIAFINPNFSESGKIAFALISYIAAGMLYTMVNIPYGAMMGVMTNNVEERNALAAFRMAGMTVGMLAVNFFAMPLILKFSHSSNATGTGYTMTSLVFSIVGFISFMIVFATSKEVVKPVKKDKVPLKDSIKSIVSSGPILKCFFLQFFLMCGMMGRVGVAVYYYSYVIKRVDLISIFMTLPQISGIIAIIISPKLADKFGKKAVVAGANLFEAIALVWIYFIPSGNVGMLLVALFIFGLGGMASPLILSMLNDAIDLTEYKTGVRSDGAAYATNGLASKAGSAVAGIGVSIMAAFGYVANQQQTAEALAGINFTVNLLPAILFFLAFLVTLTWNVKDDQAAKIRAELDANRLENHSSSEE
ncbi:MAG: MFS transporter [Bilifractor sp.]|jgi:sugar (glycoside-pentoside-hexuronide) transporter